MKNITKLERQVISAIKTGDDWYEIPHMTASEISEETEIPMKQLRGVISSLEQKDIIQESELPTCTAWMVCEDFDSEDDGCEDIRLDLGAKLLPAGFNF